MSATDYNDLARDELARLLERRDREAKQQRRFDLFWERNEIKHEAALNADFIALDLD